LRRLEKGPLFTGPEFFDECGRMFTIVGGRRIPVLLVKMMIDLAISVKESPLSDPPVPKTVVDVMVGYVNFLDRTSQAAIPSTPTLQQDAELVAWECLRKDSWPVPVPTARLLEKIGGADANARLEALRVRLGLVQFVEYNRELVHFVLHPIAEYLASLHLI